MFTLEIGGMPVALINVSIRADAEDLLGDDASIDAGGRWIAI